MVLLIEQERTFSYEANNFNDPTNYPFPIAYGTVKNYGTLGGSATTLVAYSFTIENTDTVSRTFQLRLKMGGNIVFATGAAITLAVGASVTYAGLLHLETASYAILVEGVVSAVTVEIKDLQMGLCSFNDLTGSLAVPYTAQMTADLSAHRITPLGEVLHGTIFVQVGASTPAAVTNMENPGDDFTNGIRIKVAGAQMYWVSRYHDSDAGNLNGASGTYEVQQSTNNTYSVVIEKDNANTVVNISIVCCPWILPSSTSANFPVAVLTFPQFSTLYCNLEPLFNDVPKYFKIGKKRAVSFGDASDYYYFPSGTGLLACAYTFEIPDVATVTVYAYGWGGCINQIGVDIR